MVDLNSYAVSPDEITGTPAEIATRRVVTRHMGGSLPAREFLLGRYDQSTIMCGVRDHMEDVLELCNAIREEVELLTDRTVLAVSQFDDLFGVKL